ncbi:MAG: SGNH/GDSL hydrolase family protein [Clostridiales bacterium]|nr:SGNH/GDSL hydrolase family protein [Clostridiales bacterium]
MNEIYLFGDSASQGLVLDDNGQYHVSRKGCIRLLKRKGFPIRNYAVHGYTVLQGLESFERMQIEPGSRCVIQFGGNDCDLDWDAVSQEPGVFHDGRVPLRDFRNDLVRFIREARERFLEPILVTPPALISTRFYRWVSRERNSDHILRYLHEDTESMYRWQERYATAVREVAAGESCRLLDIRNWLLDRMDYPSLFCADGIHPNEAGHEVIAEIVLSRCGFPESGIPTNG